MQFHENDDFYRQVRRAPVLSVGFEHQVEDVSLEALEANDDDRQDVLHFKDLVTETWAEGHRMNWTHFDNNGPRTTNTVERWHH